VLRPHPTSSWIWNAERKLSHLFADYEVGLDIQAHFNMTTTWPT